MSFVSFLTDERNASAAYVRAHMSTAQYVLDFLREGLATVDERGPIGELIQFAARLGKQASAASMYAACLSAPCQPSLNPITFAPLQAKYAAAPGSLQDITTRQAKDMYVDYSQLCQATYALAE